MRALVFLLWLSCEEDGIGVENVPPVAVSLSDGAISTQDGAGLPHDAGLQDDVDTADARNPWVGPCNTPGFPPLRSCRLDQWPSSGATTGTSDLTSVYQKSSVDLPTGIRPFGVDRTPDGSSVVVAAGNASTAYVYAYKRMGGLLGTSRRTTLAASSGAPAGVRVSHVGNLLAVCHDASVHFLDTQAVVAGTGGLLRTAQIAPRFADRSEVTIDAEFSPDDRFLFVSQEYQERVVVIRVADAQVVGSVPIAANAVTGLSALGSRLFVISESAHEFRTYYRTSPVGQTVGLLTEIDMDRAIANPASAAIGSVFVGQSPVRVVAREDGVAFVTARGSNRVVAIDTRRMFSDPVGALLGSVAVGAAPVGLALVRGGKALLVANSNRFDGPNSNSTATFLSVERPSAMTLLGHLVAGAFPREIAAQGNDAFLTNFNSTSVIGYTF